MSVNKSIVINTYYVYTINHVVINKPDLNRFKSRVPRYFPPQSAAFPWSLTVLPSPVEMAADYGFDDPMVGGGGGADADAEIQFPYG